MATVPTNLSPDHSVGTRDRQADALWLGGALAWLSSHGPISLHELRSVILLSSFCTMRRHLVPAPDLDWAVALNLEAHSALLWPPPQPKNSLTFMIFASVSASASFPSVRPHWAPLSLRSHFLSYTDEHTHTYVHGYRETQLLSGVECGSVEEGCHCKGWLWELFFLSFPQCDSQ